MPLRICLTNEYSKRCDAYVSLAQASRPYVSKIVKGVQNGQNKSAEAGESTGQSSPQFVTQYFLVPPMGDGRGYTVNISNLTFGGSVSVNDLEYISLTPFPYNFVKNLHRELEQVKGNKQLLVFNQAFESGFVAFCGFRLCPAEHVMVNNWANGWVFEGTADEVGDGGAASESGGSGLGDGGVRGGGRLLDSVDVNNVVILFWPQLLEYLGFLTLALWILFGFGPYTKTRLS